MKTFFDVNYFNHSIIVQNKLNTCSLVIDNVVVDTYKAIIAKNFCLSGYINEGSSTIRIDFELVQNSSRNWIGFPRSKLLLTANGEKIAAQECVL